MATTPVVGKRLLHFDILKGVSFDTYVEFLPKGISNLNGFTYIQVYTPSPVVKSRTELPVFSLHTVVGEQWEETDGYIYEVKNNYFLFNHNYVIDDEIQSGNGFVYKCTVAGLSHATILPTFPTSEINIVSGGATFILKTEITSDSKDLNRQTPEQWLSRYQCELNTVLITGGIDPFFEDGLTGITTPCWVEPTGDFQWVSQDGLLPAQTNFNYVSAKKINQINNMFDIESTYEFSMAILACDETLLKIGDSIKIIIQTDGSFRTYTTSSRFDFQTINLSPVNFSGGIAGNYNDTVKLQIDNNFFTNISAVNGVLQYNLSNIFFDMSYDFDQADVGETITFKTNNRQLLFTVDSIPTLIDASNIVLVSGITYNLTFTEFVVGDKLTYDLLNNQSITNIKKLNNDFYVLPSLEAITLNANGEYIDFIDIKSSNQTGLSIIVDANPAVTTQRFEVLNTVTSVTITNTTLLPIEISYIYCGDNNLTSPPRSIKNQRIRRYDKTYTNITDVELDFVENLIDIQNSEYGNALLIPDMGKSITYLNKYTITDVEEWSSEMNSEANYKVNILMKE